MGCSHRATPSWPPSPTPWSRIRATGGAARASNRGSRRCWGRVRTACADYLTRHRLRQRPPAANLKAIRRAALDLGIDPKPARLKAFAELFRTPLVVVIRGGIKLEPFGSGPAVPRFQGYLRCRGVNARVFHRGAGLVVAAEVGVML